VRNALALCLVLAPAAAHASDGESALSGGLGVGTYLIPDPEDDEETIAPTAGGVATVTFERGFSEALSYRVEGGGALYGGGGLSWSALVAAGVVYRFDVLKYVPYAVVELAGVAIGGGPVPETVLEPALQLGGGLDVLKSRDRSWGVEAKIASYLTGTTTMSLSLRITRRWGYF
jgi:hypothetical protein